VESKLFKDYGLVFSDKQRRQLITDEAKKFTSDSLKYSFRVFENIKNRLPHELLSSIRLDYFFHTIAVHSAYLDLWQSDNFHTLQDGPSSSKKAAALTCWLNRIKPIQLVTDSEHPIRFFLNPIFALEVGWAVSAHSGLQSTGVDGICDYIRDVMKETDLDNLLTYTLVWRTPGFRELSTLFELLK
jgi:hypothetical protein